MLLFFVRNGRNSMKKADLILYGNNIFNGKDERLISGGIAISEGKILAVGSKDEVNQYLGEKTSIKEFYHQLIMPGFVDAHDHFMEGAKFLSQNFCNTLDKARSEVECVEMMVEFAKSHPDLERYFGYGWMPSYWGEEAALPTKRSLDLFFPDKPVYLRAVDGHSEWMNSAALKESGYLNGWESEFGSVDKFEDGELNGLVREGGDRLCRKFDTLLPDQELEELHILLMKKLNAKGITTFTEMSATLPEDIDSDYKILKQMEKDQKMTLRLCLYPGTDIDAARIEEILPFLEKYKSDVLRINGLKGFVDGVTSTYTAALLEPYEDKPEEKGYLNYPKENYEEWVIKANRLGLGVRLHCIGDFAVRTILDACEKSWQVNRDILLHENILGRNTIEHIELIHEEDIVRFKELGVVASMQPLHLPLDEFDKLHRVGEKRSHFEWVHKRLLEAGAVLALGTDYPVADFDTIPNIYQAVSRKGINGTQYGPYTLDQKLTMFETLKAYTWGSAYALHMEDKIGTLEENKYADIIILDRNLFSIPEEAILETKVLMTIMNGSVVYEEYTA